MTNQPPKPGLEDLIRQALVPKGHRPATDADIEKMLGAVGSEPMSDARKDRMLRKIRGQEPVFPLATVAMPAFSAQLSPEEQEVYALCRSKNKPLPPDLAAKVKALEEKAAKKPGPGGDVPRG